MEMIPAGNVVNLSPVARWPAAGYLFPNVMVGNQNKRPFLWWEIKKKDLFQG